MGLVELANLASVVSAVLGGGSLLLQVLPFLQARGEYENLRHALQKLRAPEASAQESVYGNEAEWEELVRWLDHGVVLLAPLRRRLIRRVLIATAAIIALALTILINVPDTPGLRGTGDRLEWFDLILGTVAALLPRMSGFKAWLLSDAERTFLTNFRDLEDAFYRREVASRLNTFNYVFDRRYGHVRGSAQDELAVLTKELAALREALITRPAAETQLKVPKPDDAPASVQH